MFPSSKDETTVNQNCSQTNSSLPVSTISIAKDLVDRMHEDISNVTNFLSKLRPLIETFKTDKGDTKLENNIRNWHFYIADVPPEIPISDIETALGLPSTSKVSLTLKKTGQKFDVFLKLMCSKDKASRLLSNKISIKGMDMEIKLAKKPKWIKEAEKEIQKRYIKENHRNSHCYKEKSEKNKRSPKGNSKSDQMPESSEKNLDEQMEIEAGKGKSKRNSTEEEKILKENMI